MEASSEAAMAFEARVGDALRRYWGYDSLRPLQREAIDAGLSRRDSLVVMPTGGGKSLCYQVPPVVADRLDVVVSPLISLMKDQVDGLRESGYPAAAINSTMSDADRDGVRRALRTGDVRLLFVSPERLVQGSFLEFLGGLGVRSFAIDEAHCISHWGHDFRPEYRQLAAIKRRVTGASVHAYTATATRRVREDIVRELGLTNASVLVGTFDRPNLVYRVVARTSRVGQVMDALSRHAGEAAIVYCISRKDTEALAASLRQAGVKAAHYHAGMDKRPRSAVQDDFAAERLDVVVATVAFGMGIDRSNVRCVIHASMPKSIEHYQQETGRAGRDGLEAECVLLYSAADVVRWEKLIEASAAEAADPGPVIEAARELLGHMRRFASRDECRHKALSEYFGQKYEAGGGCGACDVCLGEVTGMPESTVIAQKILSCVARTGQSFGAGHLAEVLRGASTEGVLRRGHERLSTYGLLSDFDEKAIVNLIHQVVDQGLVERTPGDRPVIRLNAQSWAVMKGAQAVRLNDPRTRAVRASREGQASWEGVDAGLFDRLRELRKTIAQEREVPAYVVFSDVTLRHLARKRPTTVQAFGVVRGIGSRKQAEFAEQFTEVIRAYCREHGVAVDVGEPHAPAAERASAAEMSASAREAADLFDCGASVEEVRIALGRARSTVMGYLAAYIEAKRPASVEAWVEPAMYRRVVEAATALSAEGRLKPIFEHLNGEVPFDVIRLVTTHQRALSEA